eukprot:3458006-Rhodomonas_salina.2
MQRTIGEKLPELDNYVRWFSDCTARYVRSGHGIAAARANRTAHLQRGRIRGCSGSRVCYVSAGYCMAHMFAATCDSSTSKSFFSYLTSNSSPGGSTPKSVPDITRRMRRKTRGATYVSTGHCIANAQDDRGNHELRQHGTWQCECVAGSGGATRAAAPQSAQLAPSSGSGSGHVSAANRTATGRTTPGDAALSSAAFLSASELFPLGSSFPFSTLSSGRSSSGFFRIAWQQHALSQNRATHIEFGARTACGILVLPLPLNTT